MADGKESRFSSFWKKANTLASNVKTAAVTKYNNFNNSPSSSSSTSSSTSSSSSTSAPNVARPPELMLRGKPYVPTRIQKGPDFVEFNFAEFTYDTPPADEVKNVPTAAVTIAATTDATTTATAAIAVIATSDAVPATVITSLPVAASSSAATSSNIDSTSSTSSIIGETASAPTSVGATTNITTSIDSPPAGAKPLDMSDAFGLGLGDETSMDSVASTMAFTSGVVVKPGSGTITAAPSSTDDEWIAIQPSVPSGRGNWRLVFWLIRTLRSSITHSKGAYITPSVFIPRLAWYHTDIKIEAFLPKVTTCHSLRKLLSDLQAQVRFYKAPPEKLRTSLEVLVHELHQLQTNLAFHVTNIPEPEATAVVAVVPTPQPSPPAAAAATSRSSATASSSNSTATSAPPSSSSGGAWLGPAMMDDGWDHLNEMDSPPVVSTPFVRQPSATAALITPPASSANNGNSFDPAAASSSHTAPPSISRSTSSDISPLPIDAIPSSSSGHDLRKSTSSSSKLSTSFSSRYARVKAAVASTAYTISKSATRLKEQALPTKLSVEQNESYIALLSTVFGETAIIAELLEEHSRIMNAEITTPTSTDAIPPTSPSDTETEAFKAIERRTSAAMVKSLLSVVTWLQRVLCAFVMSDLMTMIAAYHNKNAITQLLNP